MSWSCVLTDSKTGDAVELSRPPVCYGGNYCIGSREAYLYITYNYGTVFRKVNGNKGLVEWLNGLTGAESIPVLEAAIAQLGDDVREWYWEPTEGNAKRALRQLLDFAKERLDGVWEIE